MGALVLNLKKGEDFYIINAGEKIRVSVDRIDGPVRFRLLVEKGFNHLFRITDQHSEEIHKNVRVSAGEGRRDIAKVTIMAPANVQIVRGSLLKDK